MLKKFNSFWVNLAAKINLPWYIYVILFVSWTVILPWFIFKKEWYKHNVEIYSLIWSIIAASLMLLTLAENYNNDKKRI